MRRARTVATAAALAVALSLTTGGGARTLLARQSGGACGSARAHHVLVLFVNGVWNSPDESATGCEALATLLRTNGVTDVDLDFFYNRSTDYAADPCFRAADAATAAGRTDRLVTIKYDPHVQRPSWAPPPPAITGTAADVFLDLKVPQEVYDELDGSCFQGSDVVEAATQRARFVASAHPTASEPDARRLARKIASEVQAGRRVIVVGHSQGSLMMAEALRSTDSPLATVTGWSQNVAGLAVASPIDWERIGAADPVIASAQVYRPGDPVHDCFSAAPTAICLPLRDANLSRHYWSGYLADATASQEIVAAIRRLAELSATAAGSNRLAGESVVLMLDLSSSMNEGAKLEHAKSAANALLIGLPTTVAVGLVTFGGSCRVVEAIAPTLDRDVLTRAVANAAADGRTPIAEAIRRVTAAVQQMPDPGHASVVLVTDGMETCEPQAAPLQEARRLGIALRLVAP